jgi:thymidylate kinase
MDREGRAGRGRYIVVAGPDGVGKSTFTDAFAAALGDRPVDRYHHRLGALPRRAASLVRTTQPHSMQPYATWLSVVKVAYLFADYLIGTAIRVRPALRSGHWVLLERGWWDIVVDPARYRLRGTSALARRLGMVVPDPDLLIVLEAPPGTILARKSELEPEELDRQLASWREVAVGRPRSIVLDSSQGIDELVRVALAALGQPAPAD